MKKALARLWTMDYYYYYYYKHLETTNFRQECDTARLSSLRLSRKTFITARGVKKNSGKKLWIQIVIGICTEIEQFVTTSETCRPSRKNSRSIRRQLLESSAEFARLPL